MGSGRLCAGESEKEGAKTRPIQSLLFHGSSERVKECCTFASASKSREEEEEEADPSCKKVDHGEEERGGG